jgi:hypothetical protein
MTDHMQIEDTREFANYEYTLEDRGASPGARVNPTMWGWSGRGRFAGGCRESRPDWMVARDMANDMFPADPDREQENEEIRNRNASVDLDQADEYDCSKIGILSDAQWVHLCNALGIDPSNL